MTCIPAASNAHSEISPPLKKVSYLILQALLRPTDGVFYYNISPFLYNSYISNDDLFFPCNPTKTLFKWGGHRCLILLKMTSTVSHLVQLFKTFCLILDRNGPDEIFWRTMCYLPGRTSLKNYDPL